MPKHCMRKHGYRFLILFIVLNSLNPILFAQKKVSYDGYVSAGWKVEYRGFGESFYRAKVQLEVDLNESVEAQVDIRGRSDRREIELRGISGTLKYWERTRLKIGHLKRTFGLEEMVSRERLFSIERSLINRHMSPMGYVGRHLTIQLYQKDREKEYLYSYYVGISYNESRTLGANARVSFHDIFGLTTLGFDAVYQRFKGELILDADTPLDAFALSADVTKEFDRYHGDGEIFFGKDPLETRIGGFIGESKSIYFTGIKFLHTYRFALQGKVVQGIEPVILVSFLVPDTRDFSFNRFQLLVGINLYLDNDVRFMVNGDLISSNSRYNRGDRNYFSSMIIAELQFRW